MTTIEEQMLIEQRVQNNGKSILVAYILLLFLGSLGIHRFYLGRIKTGIMMLMFYIGSIVFIIGGMFMAAASAINYVEANNITTPEGHEDAIVDAILASGLPWALIVGFLLLIVLSIWCFVDLFLVYGYVNKQRETLRQNLIAQFK